MQGAGREHMDKLRALQKERDEAVVELFTPQQKQAYDKLMAEYKDRIDAMSHEREKSFAKAVEETNRILDPEQQLKYAEIRKRRQERGGWGGRRGSATTQASTRSAS